MTLPTVRVPVTLPFPTIRLVVIFALLANRVFDIITPKELELIVCGPKYIEVPLRYKSFQV